MTSGTRLLLTWGLVGLALVLAAPAFAQQSERAAAEGDAAAEAAPAPTLEERLETLESEHMRLKSEVLLLRERLDAALGADPEARTHELPVGSSPIRGREGAAVTLVGFGDFQSDYSTRARHVVNRLLEEYPNDLRYIFKHFPINATHPQANEAALAALAAEKQERAWEMHDLLFQNSRRLEPTLYLLLAQQLGLDLALFDDDRRSLWALERLAEDEMVAVAAGVNGVPVFFLNGRRMKSWRYDFLKARIDELLGR